MTNFTLARVIGNELPPRDTVGNRVRSLKFVLENEYYDSNCSTLWVLNQIHDKDLLAELKRLLSGQRVVELNFDVRKYRSAVDRDQKIVEVININKARNLAIDESDGDFVFVFDGDCFFNQECWDQTVKEIAEDQLLFDRQYYGVPGLRVVEEIPSDWFSLLPHEPSLVLRKDASMRFDESIPFSKSEKIDFLVRLGYPKGEIYPQGDLCRNVGRLLHVSFNDEITERNLSARMKLRDESIDRLLNQLDYGVSFL